MKLLKIGDTFLNLENVNYVSRVSGAAKVQFSTEPNESALHFSGDERRALISWLEENAEEIIAQEAT